MENRACKVQQTHISFSSTEVVKRIQERLSEEEFETLLSSRMPAWMSEAFRQYETGRARG